MASTAVQGMNPTTNAIEQLSTETTLAAILAALSASIFPASVGKTDADIEYVVVATSSQTQTLRTLSAGEITAGAVVYLLGIQGTLTAAETLTISDSTPANLSGAMTFPTRGGLAPPNGKPLTVTAAGKHLVITVSGSGEFNGMAQILVV